MIMEFRGLSKYEYKKLLESYTPEQILQWGRVTKYRHQRKLSDRSPKLRYGQNEFTLAQIYYLVHKWGFNPFPAVTYAQFKNKCTYNCKANLTTDLRVGISMTAMSDGLIDVSDRLRRMNEQSIADMESKYLDFLNKKRPPNDPVHEQTKVNDHWADYLLKDPEMYGVYINYIHKRYAGLDNEIASLREQNFKLTEQMLEQKQIISDLQGRLYAGKGVNA